MPPKKYSFVVQLFGHLWALWGIVTFAGTFLVIFLPSMAAHLLPEKKGQTYFIAVSRIWMRIWLFLVGCRVVIHGRHHFKKGENYVVTFNHNTFMDVPLSCPFVPGANKTIAKDSFAKYPIFGQFYSRGAVLVNRSDERSRRKSYEQMKQVLRLGMHMCLYPEGTRNRTAEPLKSFYDGAFKLALETNKAIIPCILTGTRNAMPPHKKFFLLPTRLSMYFLTPVNSQNKTVAQLKEEVFQKMKAAYILHSA